MELDITETEGAVSGTLTYVSTYTTDSDTYSQGFAVTGTRTGSDLMLDVDFSGYPSTVDGTIDGDSLSIDWFIVASTTAYDLNVYCELTR